VEGEIQFVSYTDQDDKLQATCMLTLKKTKNVEIGLDYGLDFGFLHRKHVITDGIKAGIQVVHGRQRNGQHLI